MFLVRIHLLFIKQICPICACVCIHTYIWFFFLSLLNLFASSEYKARNLMNRCPGDSRMVGVKQSGSHIFCVARGWQRTQQIPGTKPEWEGCQLEYQDQRLSRCVTFAFLWGCWLCPRTPGIGLAPSKSALQPCKVCVCVSLHSLGAALERVIKPLSTLGRLGSCLVLKNVLSN